MVDFFSSWAEQIVVAVVVASLIEMLLPENKNKKYVKMVIGIYILFNIISPLVSNMDFNLLDELDLESYAVTSTASETVNQTSMDERLQELYIEELKKNIEQKAQEEGYKVSKCKVDANLYGSEENQGINSIELTVYKDDLAVSSVEKVEIRLGSEGKEDETSKEELEGLKKTLSEYYGVSENKIKIQI